jgi:hypothetical protein
MPNIVQRFSRRTVTYIVSGCLVVVFAVGSLVWADHRSSKAPSRSTLVTSTPVVSTTPVVTFTPPATPTSSITPSATPSASPTASIVSSLPVSAQAMVSAFYNADTARQSAQVAAFFTPDTTAEDKSLHARLFTGIDTNGNPGGPTLFSDGAPQSVATYTITSSVPQGANWQVSVSEQRVSESSAADGAQVTMLVLVPKGNSWLISDYYQQGQLVSKYDGFLPPS